MFLLFSSESYLQFMPSEGRNYLFIIVFNTTFLIPVLLIPIFLYRKIITSIDMESNRERILPLFLTFGSYYLGYFLIKSLPVPPVLISFILVSMLMVLVVGIISFWWKISAHMTGIGGLMGSMIAFSIKFFVEMQPVIIMMAIVAGLIGFSRLKLKAHSPAQLFAGWGIGLVSGFLLIWSFS